MPAIHSLKKQLRGIRSTQKLTKAMRTVATAKFSKLNGIYSDFAEYGRQCRDILSSYGSGFSAAYPASDPNAPALVVVMAANKGMCGSFNAELLAYAAEKLSGIPEFRLVTVGAKAKSYFTTKKILSHRNYIFSDIPTYEDATGLLSDIAEWRKSGEVSRVMFIYPEYRNMMVQVPTSCTLFGDGEDEEDDGMLFLPDRDSMIKKSAATVFGSLIYEIVLETALGAQASTLMTMRSAYDTATEYRIRLEGEINRLRQSAVTADVIETSNQ